MLQVSGLHAYYGKSHILQGVDLAIGEGEIVSLLGRNGVGRSTTCKAIMGLVRPEGEVRFKGRPIAGLRADEIAHVGLGYVPEDRQIFAGLTVKQNLELGLKRAGRFGRWTFDDMFRLFPNLGERQANQAGVLSGGEQQMLTMCRTLMGDPDLVIIDEPTEGPGAQAGRAGRPPARRDRPARHLDPAGRAETDDRAKDIEAALRHGPWPHRLRRHARRARRRCRHPQGMARSLTPRKSGDPDLEIFRPALHRCVVVEADKW